MEINFNMNLSVGVPNPIQYAYDLIHDYVYEPEDDDELEEG